MKFKVVIFILCFNLQHINSLLFAQAKDSKEIPVNNWMRFADCPGDPEGREIPPGRGSTWTYCPPLKGFLRIGGLTPRFSNALDLFDPFTKKWTRLFAEDENYPVDRPGGLCEAFITYDESRKCVWIAGGYNTVDSKPKGIWKLDLSNLKFDSSMQKVDVASLKFERIGDINSKLGKLAFDKKLGLFVVSPPQTSEGNPGTTEVFSITTKLWEKKVSKNPIPQAAWQGNFRVIYDEKSEKIVCVGALNTAIKDAPPKWEMAVWVFDGTTGDWENLNITNGPAIRIVFPLAFDYNVNQIVLFGGSNGENGEYFENIKVWNDTWYLNIAEKKWTELKTPGPSPLQSMRRDKMTNEMTLRLGLAYDQINKCMSMMDPDMGVWVFKYVVGAELAKENINAEMAM